jgi:hypothetical protein
VVIPFTAALPLFVSIKLFRFTQTRLILCIQLLNMVYNNQAFSSNLLPLIHIAIGVSGTPLAIKRIEN